MENNLKKHINTRNIIKVISLILIIFFFVPLFTVSCSGQEISFSASDLTTGNFSYSEEISESTIFCSLLLLLPIATIVVSFLVKEDKIRNIVTAAIGGVHIALLIVISSKVHELAKSMFATAKNTSGYYISILLNILLIGLAISELLGYTSMIPILSSQKEKGPIRICKNCGSKLKTNHEFCGECGTKHEELGNDRNLKRFCTECGKELVNSDRFCTNCGAEVLS